MSLTDLSPSLQAAAARSILACARHVELEIDGIVQAVADDERLGLLDLDGTPGFLCEPGRALTRAAAEQRTATLTLVSGLNPEPDASGRARTAPHSEQRLTLRGTLRSVGSDVCTCCEEPCDHVVLDVQHIELSEQTEPTQPHAHRRPLAIPVDEFRSPAHALNRGYLQRTAEHVRDSHQRELRHAAAAVSGTHPDQIIGAHLVDLTTWGVTLEWVDTDGSRQQPIWFPRLAHSTHDLATLLRACLHPEIC